MNVLEPIVCPSCNALLDPFYAIIQQIGSKLLDKSDVHIDNIYLETFPSISDVFNALHIYKQCCKMKLMSATTLSSITNKNFIPKRYHSERSSGSR